MFKKLVLTAALLAATSANADTITQWNFNSVPSDAATGTGTTVANIGTGVISLLNGVTNPSFNTGVGSSDTSLAANNSGFQTTTYAAQGAGNKTRGVQFNVSTIGFEDILVNYDLRHSNTSSRYEQFQYSLDGSNFVDFALFDGNLGDTWFNNRTIDLSSIAGADNNASFAFRVVAAFAPNTSAYAASSTTYAGSGTWRFDDVMVLGTTVAAVPEPETYALLVAGLGFVGFSARRKTV